MFAVVWRWGEWLGGLCGDGSVLDEDVEVYIFRVLRDLEGLGMIG